jgi:hypothetical protein
MKSAALEESSIHNIKRRYSQDNVPDFFPYGDKQEAIFARFR